MTIDSDEEREFLALYRLLPADRQALALRLMVDARGRSLGELCELKKQVEGVTAEKAAIIISKYLDATTKEPA